jgi:hypothetical protein
VLNQKKQGGTWKKDMCANPAGDRTVCLGKTSQRISPTELLCRGLSIVAKGNSSRIGQFLVCKTAYFTFWSDYHPIAAFV